MTVFNFYIRNSLEVKQGIAKHIYLCSSFPSDDLEEVVQIVDALPNSREILELTLSDEFYFEHKDQGKFIESIEEHNLGLATRFNVVQAYLNGAC